MSEIKLSVIIPIRAFYISSDEVIRLKLLLPKFGDGYEVIIVQDRCSKEVKKEIIKLRIEAKNKNIIIVNNYSLNKKFSLSKLRNLGAKKASAKCIMFHDVDFIGTSQTYKKIIDYLEIIKLDNNPQNFFCIPVVFLEKNYSRYITELLKNNEEKLERLKECQLKKDYIKFYVRGSSCIVLNKKDFKTIGGHNQRFKGHGAEDFELLHRLGERFPIADKPPDYSVNVGSGTTERYIGFRAYFSLYGIEAEENGCFLYHLWHGKRLTPKYYNHKKNFSLLKKMMQKKYINKGPEDRKKIDPYQYYN